MSLRGHNRLSCIELRRKKQENVPKLTRLRRGRSGRGSQTTPEAGVPILAKPRIAAPADDAAAFARIPATMPAAPDTDVQAETA
jgi:hypothetical protein